MYEYILHVYMYYIYVVSVHVCLSEYEGAIPLLEHRDMLTKDLGVDAVLSIVEDFELDCSTAIGRYRTLCILFCTLLT
jgi:hypothetical protein